jgi:hypothetical protein
MFFTQTLSALVVNTKLERPLDSQAPQTEHVYAYVVDDWGDVTRTSMTINGTTWPTNGNRQTTTNKATKLKTHIQQKKSTRNKISMTTKPKERARTLMKMIKMVTFDMREAPKN